MGMEKGFPERLSGSCCGRGVMAARDRFTSPAKILKGLCPRQPLRLAEARDEAQPQLQWGAPQMNLCPL